MERVPKTIQIRHVPDDVHRTLRAQAAEAGMSLSDFLLAEIEQLAGRSVNAAIIRQAGERTGGVSNDAIIAALRSGRDR